MQDLYASKAEKYAKYRWDYALQAITRIFTGVGVSTQTIVADTGAGPGVVTKHCVGKTKLVYAIEPESEMRAFAEKIFCGHPSCKVLAAAALPAHFYYGNDSLQRLLFPFEFSLNWEHFLGSLNCFWIRLSLNQYGNPSQ